MNGDMGTNRSKWFTIPVAERRQRVSALHAKGLTNIVIARRLGIADTTVSQDLLALGLRKPKQQAAHHVTPHGLGKLDLVSLQALFLEGLSSGERRAMTGKSAALALAELSRDQLIAAILRRHEETAATGYPRVPDAASAPAIPPQSGGARAGAGGATGAAARPEPMAAAS